MSLPEKAGRHEMGLSLQARRLQETFLRLTVASFVPLRGLPDKAEQGSFYL